MDYAPNNEQGVIFLFSKLARSRFGLRIESIRAGFPDCIAYQGEKRIRIEFEYRSRNFVQHKHPVRGCDWIVCWIHDWPSVPRNLRIVELRRTFGVGFNIWFQPVAGEFSQILTRTRFDRSWSVPSQALQGDLLLFYRARPDMFVRDIFTVAGPVGYVRAGWKPGMDWMAPIRRVCTLKAPLHFQQMKTHSVLRHAGFIRGSMRGRYKASEYWPELHSLLCGTNPPLRRLLARFGPERLA